MSRANCAGLADCVARAAEASPWAQHWVSAVDVLLGIDRLDPATARRWRHGQIDCLEEALQVNPARLAHTLELFQCWAAQKGLLASAADYAARAPKRQLLRFSQSRRRYERLGLLVEREALAETRARAR